MPQVQPIYLPTERRKTFASDLGGLLGLAVEYNLKKKEKEEHMAEVQQFTEAVRKAPDRAAAFEVVSNYTGKMKTPSDYTTALKLVDEMHPASMETPTPMPAYDEMGNKTTIFPSRKQMTDPNFWTSSGVTLTEPNMLEFFQPVPSQSAGQPGADPNAPPVFQSVGKLPFNKRPEGALTKDEIGLARQDKADIRADAAASRADAAAERADIRLSQSTQRMEDAQKRTESVLARMAENMKDKDVRAGQSASAAFTRLAAISLNGRVLPDGTFDFAGDVDKADQFVKMVEHWNTRIEANPKLLDSPTVVTRIFSEARRTVVPKDEVKPVEPPKKESKGLKDRVTDWWDRTTAPPKKPEGKKEDAKKPTMSSADKQASVKSAKEAAERVRKSAASNEDKRKLLDTIRKRLKDAGINEEI